MRRLLGLVCCFVFAALVGCGDDEETITKEDFVEQGNAICSEGDDELQAKAEELGDSPTEDDIAEFVSSEFVPETRSQIEALRDLGFPDGDEDELEGILDDAEAKLDEIADDPSTFAASDEDPFADISASLDEYGLTECGSG